MTDDRAVRSHTVPVILATAAALACPPTPSFRDADGTVTLLSQNLKFIATGALQDRRAALLSEWLGAAGETVDLMLLSEARSTDPLERSLDGWCFYTQVGRGLDGYAWAPARTQRAPGGLVLGVRERPEGRLRAVDGPAGRRFRSRSVSLAEGLLGRVVGFVKGWAGVEVDGTRVVWTHTQASYSREERGAGGRAGQFADLADDLGRSDRPTLLTGDLNVQDDADNAAGAIDRSTLAAFFERTGIRVGGARDACDGGTFFGSLAAGETRGRHAGRSFDRVGVNEAFRARHPGTQVTCEEIRGDALRLSDHRGLVVRVPFEPATMAR